MPAPESFTERLFVEPSLLNHKAFGDILASAQDEKIFLHDPTQNGKRTTSWIVQGTQSMGRREGKENTHSIMPEWQWECHLPSRWITTIMIALNLKQLKERMKRHPCGLDIVSFGLKAVQLCSGQTQLLADAVLYPVQLQCHVYQWGSSAMQGRHAAIK